MINEIIYIFIFFLGGIIAGILNKRDKTLKIIKQIEQKKEKEKDELFQIIEKSAVLFEKAKTPEEFCDCFYKYIYKQIKIIKDF